MFSIPVISPRGLKVGTFWGKLKISNFQLSTVNAIRHLYSNYIIISTNHEHENNFCTKTYVFKHLWKEKNKGQLCLVDDWNSVISG